MWYRDANLICSSQRHHIIHKYRVYLSTNFGAKVLQSYCVNLTMVGRKPAVATEIVNALLCENKDRIINSRKRVIIPKSTIWNELTEDDRIRKLMTAKALYTMALKWWAKCQNPELIEGHPIQEEESKQTPTTALQHFQASNASNIFMTGLDPFYVIYGSPGQFSLFDEYKKANKYKTIIFESCRSVVSKICKFCSFISKNFLM